eukprot:EC714138.1.p1 GENE.EC714138.1~~EC714138.1.p1  ORF type:complete len:70 (+),score=10.36 EC714138.1:56-265(+)
MSAVTKFNVEITCGGCVNAVRRVLERMEGVQSVDISLEQELVTVQGTATPADMLEKILKTGKAARLASE